MASREDTLCKDQAAGLRQLASAPLPALCTMLSADEPRNKRQILQRLAQSRASRGQQVLLIDARTGTGASRHTLMDVAQGRVRLDEVVDTSQPGVQCVTLGRVGNEEAQGQLLLLVRQLSQRQFHLLVDAELGATPEEAHLAGFPVTSSLPLPLLTEGELVLQVPAEAAAICRAYDIMRALRPLCITRALSLLVTGDSAAHARRAQANLFHAARRYLSMPVRAIVPAGAA